MSSYAYVRVSSDDQNPDRQIDAMIEAGIARSNIFVDKQSGKDFEREQWKRLCQTLEPGDVLYVKSIDRLGRNYNDITFVWRHLTNERSVDIVVLDMPLLDTRNKKDLMGTVISDIVLQLLSYVAQTEREFIKQRQAEGIALAKKRGVRFGREAKLIPDNFRLVYEKHKRGEISIRQAGRELGVSHTLFLKWAKDEDNGKDVYMCHTT